MHLLVSLPSVPIIPEFPDPGRRVRMPARSNAVMQRAYSLATGNDETIFFVEADTCDVTRLWNNVVSFCYENLFLSLSHVPGPGNVRHHFDPCPNFTSVSDGKTI